MLNQTTSHQIHNPSHTMSSRLRPFSKYDFVKSFLATNNAEEQATIIADAIEETQLALLENLATKQDIRNLEKDIKNLEIDLKKDIKNLEKDIKNLEVDLKKDIKNLEKDIKNLEVDLKKDIKNLEVDLKKDIKNLEIDFKKDMKLLELSLKKEMQGQLIKLGSLMVVLLTIMPFLTEFLKKLF